MRLRPRAVVPVHGVPHPCPSCGRTLNAIMCPDDQQPTAGDWTVCYECLAVLRFTGVGFAVRLATPTELEAAIAAGELDPDDGDLLRHSFAQRHGDAGGHV